MTTSLTQARAGITLTFAHQLANQLGVDGDALTRELTDYEAEAWAFYRLSARNPALVWANARRRWEAAGLTQSDVSRIIGIRQANLSMSLAGKRRDILDFQQAAKLLASVTSFGAPGDLLVKD